MRILRQLRLEPDDVIIPPFAVIAVIVATQGKTLLLTLFSFCGDPLVLEGTEDIRLFVFLSSPLSLKILFVGKDETRAPLKTRAWEANHYFDRRHSFFRPFTSLIPIRQSQSQTI